MARAFASASSQAISTGTSSNFNFERTNSWTISAWVLPNQNTGVTSACDIFSKLQSSGNNTGYELFLDCNGAIASKNVIHIFMINVFSSNNLINLWTGNTVSNAWHHIAWTYNGTSTDAGNKIYLDAVSQSLTSGGHTLSATIQNAIVPYIGSRNNVTQFMNGTIADLAIFNVVLTQTEITSLSQGIRPPQVRSGTLVGYYPLDGLQSPEPDLSGNAINGTLVNAPTQAFGPPIAPLTPRWPTWGWTPMLPAAGLGWIINRRNKLTLPKKRIIRCGE